MIELVIVVVEVGVADHSPVLLIEGVALLTVTLAICEPLPVAL